MNRIVKVLWPELKPYSGRLLAILLLGVLVSGLKGLLPPLLTMLEEAWRTNNHNKALLIPAAVSVIYLLASGGRYLHLFWMKYISDLVAMKLRRDLMDKYLSLNLSFFQSFMRGSGGLISRMINDINLILNGIHKIADLLREPFMAVFMFGYLLYIDWVLTIFILLALPFITGALRRLAKSLRKYSNKNQEYMEDLTKTLKESLDGTRIVRSFNLEDEMRERFNRQADDYLQTRRKIISREEAAGPISETLAAFTLSLILIYIGNQIFNRQLTIGDFLGFSFAIGLLQDSIKKIQGGYIKLQQASVAIDRMQSIMDSANPVEDPANPVAFPGSWDSIEFRNLTFSFGENKVLDDINLTVRKGEVVAIVGSSGGGKSTLVNLLQRFFDPDQGEILIGGTPIKNISLKALRSQIAMVSQDVFLFSDTIEKNIHSGDFSKPSEGIEKAAKLANAHDFIMRTAEHYQTCIGDQASTLSGGEKQRISIARAIFKDAPILILDEATSALDSESELEVQKGLDHLLEGRTAFVIAHRLSTITKANRILVLKNGKIVEEGSHSQLIEHQGEYFKLHQLQASL